jgi:serine/threonine-protein kinase
MSPEQAAGDTALDGRSDMFSLGLVLFEMLAGERPFQHESASPWARLMVQSAPSLRQRRRELPADLDQILKRALAADPDKRFPSMTAMAEELTALRFGRPVERKRPASAAVLPFRVMSAGEDQTYFGDGLAEELTTALSRIRGLKVAARSGAFRYRGADVDVREAGRELGVATVLSGSVRRSGDRLRVSAQLASVEEGFEIWSDTYDRKMADVFEVQEEIAGAIAQALQVTLAAPEERPERPAPDVQAYDLYLRGRFAWHQRTGATLAEAMRYFEQAAARDPGFARAWAGLADTCTLLPMYTDAEPGPFWKKAKEAARRAIALDDTLADAHTSLAYGTMLYEWNWEGAEREVRLAIAVDPTYQVAHHWYADFLAGRGRLEEALASMQRARELDPLSRITWVEIAWIYHMMGKIPEAEAALAEVFRVDPQYSHAHFMQGLVQLASGRPDHAARSLRHSIELGGDHVHARGAMISALAKSGRRDEALRELAAMEARAKREHVPEFGFVVAYAGLGELDKAYAALERAIGNKDLLTAENFFEPVLDPLRDDPRYPALAGIVRGTR